MINYYKDEQLMEIEALEALYTSEEEFEKISDDEFYINIVPYPDNSKDNYASVKLKIKYVPKYPEEPPLWHFERLTGIEHSGEVELRNRVEAAIHKSFGMPMIYDIADTIQVWLRENNKPQLSMHAQMIEREIKREEENDLLIDDENEGECQDNDETEEKHRHSKDNEAPFTSLIDRTFLNGEERVTEAEFLKWSREFRLEMESRGIWKLADVKESAPTGKQLFLQDSTLAFNDEEEGENSV